MNAVGVLMGALILLLICSDSDGRKDGKADYGMRRDDDGNYYIYDKASGSTVERFPSRQEAYTRLRELNGK